MKCEYEFKSAPRCKVFKTGSTNGQLVTVKPELLGREKKGGEKAKPQPLCTLRSGTKFLPPLLYGKNPPTSTLHIACVSSIILIHSYSCHITLTHL